MFIIVSGVKVANLLEELVRGALRKFLKRRRGKEKNPELVDIGT